MSLIFVLFPSVSSGTQNELFIHRILMNAAGGQAKYGKTKLKIIGSTIVRNLQRKLILSLLGFHIKFMIFCCVFFFYNHINT